MKYLLFFVSLNCTINAYSAVIIPAPSTNPHEYEALLKAQPDDQSPLQYLQRARPERKNRENLLKALARAQEAFLNQSLDLAREHFKEIDNYFTIDDWTTIDHGVFIYAYLRLAQLEADPDQKNEWLKKAAVLPSDAPLEPNLIPPPLLRELHDRRKSFTKMQFPDSVFDEWPLILVNGQRCTRKVCDGFSVYKHVRITWLSNIWLPYSATLRVDDVLRHRPKKIPWVSGNCDHFELHKRSKDFIQTQPFFNFACEDKKNYRISLNSQNSDNLPSLNMEIKTKTLDFYQSTWFWAGIGTVLAAFVVHSHQRQGHQEPTTIYER